MVKTDTTSASTSVAGDASIKEAAGFGVGPAESIVDGVEDWDPEGLITVEDVENTELRGQI